MKHSHCCAYMVMICWPHNKPKGTHFSSACFLYWESWRCHYLYVKTSYESMGSKKHWKFYQNLIPPNFCDYMSTGKQPMNLITKTMCYNNTFIYINWQTSNLKASSFQLSVSTCTICDYFEQSNTALKSTGRVKQYWWQRTDDYSQNTEYHTVSVIHII